MHTQGSTAPGAGHFVDVAVHQMTRGCIYLMQFYRRVGTMTGQACRLSGAGHGVPLVAHSPRVQSQRLFDRWGMHGRARRDHDEASAPVRMKEAALGEEASATRLAIGRRGPNERRQGLVAAIVEIGIGTDVEIARGVILEGRKCCMLAEDV